MSLRQFLVVAGLVLALSLGLNTAIQGTRSRAVAEELREQLAFQVELSQQLTALQERVQAGNEAIAQLLPAYSSANAVVESYTVLSRDLALAQTFDLEAAVQPHQEQAEELVAIMEESLGVSEDMVLELQAELSQLQEEARLRQEVLDQLELATVTRIIDGDTIEVEINGTTERVRFIAVDAPERRQAGFQEATDFVAAQIPVGTTVWLQADGRNRDVFRRLRRYVWVQQPTDLSDEDQVRARMLNAMLLEHGHASVHIMRGDSPRYEALFRSIGY